MNDGKRRWKQLIPPVAVLVLFNLYFFLFIPGGKTEYMIYLDILFLVPFALLTAAGWQRFVKHEREKKELMAQNELICRTMPAFENQDLAEHDVRILEEQLSRQLDENRELQDFVAKWCHECKIPLAAGLLMNERIQDGELRMAMREQLEKMNQQINGMLLGCRIQSPVFDIQVKKTKLWDCVRTSLQNNRFFLIQKGFELTIKTRDEMVYTDPLWLVYVLDQLINNAIKYGIKQEESGESTETGPKLHIWSEKDQGTIRLFVEDQGEGIKDSDIRRIFEKGFTGNSYHNGKYKSTGMGLYMVSKIMDRLGHKIYAESRYGVYTRFCIVFQENDYFLNEQQG